MKCQKDYAESIKKLEEQWAEKQEKHGQRKVKFGPVDDGIDQKSNSEVLQSIFSYLYSIIMSHCLLQLVVIHCFKVEASII